MKAIVYYLIILLLLTVSFLTSCDKPDVSENPDLVNSLYANSDDTLNIGMNKFILETYIYRNLMPGGPIPTKRPLVALVFLFDIDSLAIPSNINITRLYVIKDQLIWISKPVDSNQPNVPDFKLDKVSNDGPEWETEIYVDIVVEVVDNSLNDKYLLIARHQYILKLE
jgi:hypothetical protein